MPSYLHIHLNYNENSIKFYEHTLSDIELNGRLEKRGDNK